MPEKPFTGLTAKITIGDVPVGYMSGVNLNLEKDIIEVLQFGARYQEKVPAIKNWTASVDGTVAFAPGGSQKKLYDAYQNDELVKVGIFLDDYTYFEGNAYIGNLSIDGAPDDKMNISCDLEGNGDIDLTVTPTYEVTASSGVGGTCTPGGTKKVASGESYSVTIAPAPGYTIDDVLDDGVEVTPVANVYTIASVTANHNIVITFKTTSAADKTSLRAAINYGDTLTQSAYTPASWSAFTTKLTAAKTVNGNVLANQTQVDNALADLNEAIHNLVLADE